MKYQDQIFSVGKKVDFMKSTRPDPQAQALASVIHFLMFSIPCAISGTFTPGFLLGTNGSYWNSYMVGFTQLRYHKSETFSVLMS